MSCNNCNNCNEINVDFSPGEINITGLFEGSTRKQDVQFTNQDGTAINIASDTFSMVIKSGTTTIATLTVGSGLAVSGNTLTITITAPVTTNDGVYDYLLTWNRTATGESFPVLSGIIEVKPL